MNVEKLTWYVARSGGIVAWALLAFALIWGLLLSSRVLDKRSSPAWLLAVHRHVGGLSVIFTIVHVGAVMLDDFVEFGWIETLVPFTSEWKPGAVAWGIIGVYLLVAIELTSLAMRWLPKGLWRGVHWASAGLFVVATLHGWQAGTDSGRAFIVAIIAVSLVLAALTAVRVLRARANAASEEMSARDALLIELRARVAESGAADAAPEEPTSSKETTLSEEVDEPEETTLSEETALSKEPTLSEEVALSEEVDKSEPVSTRFVQPNRPAATLAEAIPPVPPSPELALAPAMPQSLREPAVAAAPAPVPVARLAKLLAAHPAAERPMQPMDTQLPSTEPRTNAGGEAANRRAGAATLAAPEAVATPETSVPQGPREQGPAVGVWKRRARLKSGD